MAGSYVHMSDLIPVGMEGLKCRWSNEVQVEHYLVVADILEERANWNCRVQSVEVRVAAGCNKQIIAPAEGREAAGGIINTFRGPVHQNLHNLDTLEAVL